MTLQPSTGRPGSKKSPDHAGLPTVQPAPVEARAGTTKQGRQFILGGSLISVLPTVQPDKGCPRFSLTKFPAGMTEKGRQWDDTCTCFKKKKKVAPCALTKLNTSRNTEQRGQRPLSTCFKFIPRHTGRHKGSTTTKKKSTLVRTQPGPTFTKSRVEIIMQTNATDRIDIKTWEECARAHRLFRSRRPGRGRGRLWWWTDNGPPCPEMRRKCSSLFQRRPNFGVRSGRRPTLRNER